MEITRIAVTGGERTARIRALDRIQGAFAARGGTALRVPDVPTLLRAGGLSTGADSEKAFRRACLRLQREAERAFEAAAQALRTEQVLILCDGGAMDAAVGLSAEELGELLRGVDATEVELRDGYDAVFQLFSTVEGSAEDAARTAAWTGTPHLRAASNIDELVRLARFFLGDPEPLEIERKFLVECPGPEWLTGLPACRRIEISQIYLLDRPGTTSRVRQRGADGSYIYYHTQKIHIDDVKHVELERRIDREEYESLLRDADPARRPISKDRYCFMYDKQYFELDVFPFWRDQAVLEIELEDEDAPVRLPEGIRVLREVTTDPEFKNSNLALRSFA